MASGECRATIIGAAIGAFGVHYIGLPWWCMFLAGGIWGWMLRSMYLEFTRGGSNADKHPRQ